ncbi:epimerase [Verrucomicrobiota bacterium]|nr:epimerase [Verrucomicrobiota bacterium]
MRILISGASGLIGSALVAKATALGHEVVRLVRSPPTATDRTARLWNPARGVLDPAAMHGFDAVVNLAGENIAGRWTRAKKDRILQSRMQATSLLATTLARLSEPPRVFVSASAIGYYGNRGDEEMTELSGPGTGFEPQVCCDWEHAAAAAKERGIRTVFARFGIVLSAAGGALAKMLPAFRLGLGGVVGSGEQYWSWIALEDAVNAIFHLLETEALAGPVNLVSLEPATNREFTAALGAALRRPTVLPLPAFAVKLLFGQMGEEVLLSSTRVKPARLLETAFQFTRPHLDAALAHALAQRKF